MKALITAGGHATRLRPITWNRNKHLIPLANRPMLSYAIEKIVKAGIHDIAININPGDKIIPKKFGSGSDFGCHLTYIEQKGGARGLAHIIKNAKDYGFLNNTSFLMYLGDNILLADLSKMVRRFHEEKHNCLLALSRVSDPERFGVAEIVNGKIVSVEEKPEYPKSNFAITGIYLYDANALSAVENMQQSDRGEYEITDVHQYYIDNGLSVGYEEITGWWKDTGKPEDLLVGNQFLLDEIKGKDAIIHETVKLGPQVTIQGKVSIGEGSVLGDKVLVRGPVIIGKNTQVYNSYIGPYTSIGDEVDIRNAEVEHSIVFNRVKINSKKRIADSIIGCGASVVDSGSSLPSGHKLVVGDNSFIEL